MKLFVDTGGWTAIAVKSDRYHQRALAFFESLRGRVVELITSDYVLDETLTLIRKQAGHQKAVEIGSTLLQSPRIRITNMNQTLWDEAWRIFRRYSDKQWSFTDCTSFALMDELEIGNAFAFDKNFRQYGKGLLP